MNQTMQLSLRISTVINFLPSQLINVITKAGVAIIIKPTAAVAASKVGLLTNKKNNQI